MGTRNVKRPSKLVLHRAHTQLLLLSNYASFRALPVHLPRFLSFSSSPLYSFILLFSFFSSLFSSFLSPPSFLDLMDLSIFVYIYSSIHLLSSRYLICVLGTRDSVEEEKPRASVIVNHHSQLDQSWRHLGDRALGMRVNTCLQLLPAW